MKHLWILLIFVIFLSGCSGQGAPIELEYGNILVKDSKYNVNARSWFFESPGKDSARTFLFTPTDDKRPTFLLTVFWDIAECVAALDKILESELPIAETASAEGWEIWYEPGTNHVYYANKNNVILKSMFISDLNQLISLLGKIEVPTEDLTRFSFVDLGTLGEEFFVDNPAEMEDFVPEDFIPEQEPEQELESEQEPEPEQELEVDQKLEVDGYEDDHEVDEYEDDHEIEDADPESYVIDKSGDTKVEHTQINYPFVVAESTFYNNGFSVQASTLNGDNLNEATDSFRSHADSLGADLLIDKPNFVLARVYEQSEAWWPVYTYYVVFISYDAVVFTTYDYATYREFENMDEEIAMVVANDDVFVNFFSKWLESAKLLENSE